MLTPPSVLLLQFEHYYINGPRLKRTKMTRNPCWFNGASAVYIIIYLVTKRTVFSIETLSAGGWRVCPAGRKITLLSRRNSCSFLKKKKKIVFAPKIFGPFEKRIDISAVVKHRTMKRSSSFHPLPLRRKRFEGQYHNSVYKR